MGNRIPCMDGINVNFLMVSCSVAILSMSVCLCCSGALGQERVLDNSHVQAITTDETLNGQGRKYLLTFYNI